MGNNDLTTEISIRKLNDIDDLEKITDLQVQVWGFDYRDAIPAHIMKSIGVGPCTPLGAEIDGKMVGFIYTFPTPNPKKQYLHMIGIHPDYQSKSVGEELFKEQLKQSQSYGIETLEWTYDPLECANAKLYIAKIGGIVEGEYQRDNYGNQDGINDGLPSDRLNVTWRVNSERVKKKFENKNERSLDKIIGPEEILIEVHHNFQEIKKLDFDEAIKWRYDTRELFENFFSQGYHIMDFISKNGTPDGLIKNFYLLEKSENKLIRGENGRNHKNT